MARRPPEPPPTRAEELEEQLHGERVRDPFRWLEDGAAPEVRAWIDAQDAHARAFLAGAAGRDALARRLAELLYVEALHPPAIRGGRLFYMRTHPDQEKAVIFVRFGEDGPERPLLDPNGWSEDKTASLGVWVPSWDGRKVAFQRRPHASDEAVLHVIDVDSGQWSEVDVIHGAQYTNPCWLPDSSGFVYERQPVDRALPAIERIARQATFLHRLGEDPALDRELFPATGDPSRFLSSWLSHDGRHLVVTISKGWSENDIFLRRQGEEAFVPFIEGRGAGYTVNAWGDALFVMTDEGAPRGRVFRVESGALERARWKELVPEDPEAVLKNVAIVGGRLALRYLRSASTELRLVTLEGAPVRTLAMPEPIGVSTDLYGLEDEEVAYRSFSAFQVPPRIERINVSTGEASPWHAQPARFDPDALTSELLWFRSKDGTPVSMFLFRRRDAPRDGQRRVVLFGYGGFTLPLTPAYVPTVLPWVEEGGLYAVAHCRGGGEYGSAWHDAGARERKQNVFDDFIAAAEHLIAQGWTRPERLAISGGSNGGLLVAAAMTQRPELFGAVVCSVPLTDMLRFHRFSAGALWVPEFGSPDQAEDFRVLRAYSPYHAVRPGVRYPPLLMHSADHDDRVDPLHARKLVAAIQTAHPDNVALLRVERDAGHLGADQIRRLVDSRADQYAWLREVLA